MVWVGGRLLHWRKPADEKDQEVVCSELDTDTLKVSLTLVILGVFSRDIPRYPDISQNILRYTEIFNTSLLSSFILSQDIVKYPEMFWNILRIFYDMLYSGNFSQNKIFAIFFTNLPQSVKILHHHCDFSNERLAKILPYKKI